MREIKAITGGRITIKDNVEEIYEKKLHPMGMELKLMLQRDLLEKGFS